MRSGMKYVGKTASVTMMALLAVGCETSSHKTVRSYDYSDEGRAARPAERQPVEREDQPSDGRMVAPGGMVAPGEMVPPGQPVVEPKREP